MTRRTADQAEADGFIVDRHTRPWFAYKGPRFAPTAAEDIATPADLNQEDLNDLHGAIAEVLEDGYDVASTIMDILAARGVVPPADGYTSTGEPI